MPSWNIHTAHVECLLNEDGAERLGIHDPNVFLVGNFVPDIYVGYMVPSISYRIDYKMTHLARRSSIPVPNYQLFWEFYVDNGFEPTTDLVLGAWAHLVADHVYNKRTRKFLASVGIEPGKEARIAKQADFALFGRTLHISRVPELTDALVEQGAAFHQYSIAKRDLAATVEVAQRVVELNKTNQLDSTPNYRLLNAQFFKDAFEETHEIISSSLRGRVESVV